jgi:hypothetical protein
LEYCGIYIFDQLTKITFADRLKSLQRVIISTYFFSADSLEAFIGQLPELSYLEMSQISLNDNLITKCSEKFRTMVVYSHPDMPMQKRQAMQTRF